MPDTSRPHAGNARWYALAERAVKALERLADIQEAQRDDAQANAEYDDAMDHKRDVRESGRKCKCGICERY